MVQKGQATVIAGDFSTSPPGTVGSVAGDGPDLGNLEKLSVRTVPIADLHPGLHLRQAGVDEGHIALLVEAARGDGLPPILVQTQGWRVIDGLHRLEAVRRCGRNSISVRFVDCADSEALVLAVKANTHHGLPLSKTDRIRGAQRVLGAHPDWSDRVIAGITGLSARTVASLRVRSGDGSDQPAKRLGRDGRRRPVAGGEGRRRAAEYLLQNPKAPLRQVARATDVSLGTVHDVSARLRRGTAPQAGSDVEPAENEPNLSIVPNAAAAPGPRARRTRSGASTAARPGPGSRMPAIRDGSPGANDPAAPAAPKAVGNAPLTWAGVAATVASDPAVRYTEGGKDFLRWMAAHAADPDGWRDFVETIPAHWLSVIAPIAEGVSKEWGLLAEQLKHKQDPDR
ncbi:ParB/RepB/Spo0J family partition protein [Kineosporia babensis]|uniref:ParB N-terminal domain-containing protein n=1 Tax=Kineosporia babensis TaxID=499548 RepID=A0A9X1NL25_9ACTN|nr:ParB N-terminal domain-containing protein [Kineosporia babensis]MCD5315749.1 ParB N-terminal domain-containing protein [Kineosporia babensis]